MAELDSSGIETLSPLFFRTSISLCVVAGCLAGYRLFSTYDRRGWLGIEDGSVFSSLFFLTLITAIGCKACQYGFGYHLKDIPKIHGDRSKALLYFWLFQIFYKLAIACNKLSFLTLYLRIFPQKTIRNTCLITISIIVAGTFAFVLATALECLPVSKNWIKAEPGTCINNEIFRWCWAAFNTVTDLWVVAIPMPAIYKLQMSVFKRMGASIIFALGLFIVAISAFRMKALVQSVTRTDTTWDSAPAFIWSHVEAAVGLIATCLPVLRRPLAKILPSKLVGTAGYTSGHRPQYKMHTLSGKLQSDTGTAGHKGRSSVYVTTQSKTDEAEERESQERILLRDPGITVRTDVTVQSVEAAHMRYANMEVCKARDFK